MKKILLSFVCGLFLFSTASAEFLDQYKVPEWANYGIDALVERGVLSGNDDGTFAPDREMNRAEFCKLIVNATGVDKYLPLTSSFPDIERSDWFFDYVETAKHYGWVSGYPDGTFQPAGKINRAEVAKITAIAFGLDIPELQEGEIWSDPYFNALDKSYLLPHGLERNALDAGHKANRAEISEQVYRMMKFSGKLSAVGTNDEEQNEPTVEEDTTPTEEETETPQDEIDTAEIDTESQTSARADNPIYEYTETMDGTMSIDPDAGDLYVSKYPDLPRKQEVHKGAKGVVLHKFTVSAKDGLAHVGGFTFRRIGSGTRSAFQKVWLEMGSKAVTEKVYLTDDVITLPLIHDVTIGMSEKIFTLKSDMAVVPTTQTSSRFVLYRPDWIDADTDVKIGMFPIGGIDIFVR